MLSTERSNTFSLLSELVDDQFRWDPLSSLQTDWAGGIEIDPHEVVDIANAASDLCDEFRVPRSGPDTCTVFGMEVGDDRVDLSRNPLKLAIGLITQERVFGMHTSWEDTCISKSVWNFCEITNGLPSDISETFDFCRKNDGFENLGFIDSPPLRIILDVTKGDGSHSSTASGKAAMLGTRMKTPRTSMLRVLQLASFIQDGMLRTSMSSDPKYLPRIMGGSGVRALYDNPDNLYLYTLAYKGGKCNRIYGSATRELQQCLRELSNSRATMPVLCRMLGDRQEYLHGTYSNMIFAPKYSFKDVTMETLPAPLIENPGGANRFSSSLNRLVRTKHLVPRSIALREWQYTKTIRARLLSRIGRERLEFEEHARKGALRKKFGDALTANTAFANLLSRNADWRDVESLLHSDTHYTITSGVSEFTRWDAEWLHSGAKYEDYSIEDLTISEDLYSRKDVSEEQTFKVGGLLLRPIIGFKQTRVETTSSVGLYQISKTMEEWSENLFQRLLSHRTGDLPLNRDDILTEVQVDPEWVNDDTTLIERCLRDTKELHQRSARVVLVSQDKRLANQMSNTCNVQVERLHPEKYILQMKGAGLDPIRDQGEAYALLRDRIPKRERSDPVRQVYVDTGSVAHYLTNMEGEGEGPEEKILRRRNLDHGVSEDGTRWTRYTLQELPAGAQDLYTVPFRPVLRDRRFPHKVSRNRSSFGSYHS